MLAYRDVIGEVCLSDLSFPAAEFEGRLAAIRDKMKAAGLDALILTRGENIFYASGFRASHFASWLSELHALIVPAQGAPRLMTRALEREIAKLQWTGSPQLYLDHENPYELLVKILRESGNDTKTIGIEERVPQGEPVQAYSAAPAGRKARRCVRAGGRCRGQPVAS